MKQKLLIAAVAVVTLMTACSKNETNQPQVDNNNSTNSIEFKALASKQTKALALDGTNVVNEALELRAYQTDDKNFADFYERPLSWIDGYLTHKGVINTETSFWEGDHTYYWPSNKKHKLSFFSYSPKYTGADGKPDIKFTDPAGYQTNVTYPSFGYVVAKNINDQKDVVAAATMNVTQKDADGNENVVNLNYKHILSQVYFKVKTTDNGFKVKVNSIRIRGAKNEATFTYNGTSDIVGSWSGLTGYSDHIYRSTESAGFIGDAATRVLPDGDATGVLMLMPQPASDDLIVEIRYNTYVTGTDALLARDVIKSATMEPLVRGKKYAYTLIVPNDQLTTPIRFSVGVTAWEDPEEQIDVRFDAYELLANAPDPADPDQTNPTVTGWEYNATRIENLIVNFAGESARTNPYTHSINFYKKMMGTLELDLTDLGTIANIPVKGSKIILDFDPADDLNATNFVEIKNLPVGWKSSTLKLVAAGQIVLTKE